MHISKDNAGPKHRILLIICGAVLLHLSCPRSEDAKNCLTECLQAIVRADFKAVYGYFSFEDKSVKSLEEFLKDQAMTREESEIAHSCGPIMSYDIKSLDRIGDSAVAVVSMVVPDVVANRLSFLFTEVERIHVVDTITTSHGRSIFVSQVQGSVFLIHEHDGWRVHGRWEKKRIEEAKEALIRSAYIEDSITVKQIKVYGKRRDRDAYLTALVLNNGNRALSKIELLISFLDRQKKAIYSLTSVPVSDNTLPLRAGEKRAFREALTGIPANWASIVEIRVVNCRFFD